MCRELTTLIKCCSKGEDVVEERERERDETIRKEKQTTEIAHKTENGVNELRKW